MNVCPVKEVSGMTQNEKSFAVEVLMMAPTLLWILLFSFVYTRRAYAGFVETVVCEDTECCEDCNTIAVDPVHFDGVCRRKRNHYETHFCSPRELHYVHNIYESEHCDDPPIRTFQSGQCYQRLIHNTGEWVSYFLVCHHVILDSNQQSGEKDEDYMHLIEALVIFLVLSCGIFGGYIVYKTQCFRKKNNSNDSRVKSQLLDCS